MKKNGLFAAFFVLVLVLAFRANSAQATQFESSQLQAGNQNGTLPGTPSGTLPATSTPDGTLPPTQTPGSTLPPTNTPGAAIPATATPSSIVTPVVTGTPPGVPTPGGEPTPANNLPAPEALLNLSIGVNKQRLALGEIVIFSILIGNISSDSLQTLEIEVTTPAGTRFVSGQSSVGWQLVEDAVLHSAAKAPCPDDALSGAVCALTLPGLMQNSIAVADFAVRLDESTPIGASQIELSVRINGVDFNGSLNGKVTVEIDPTRRQFLPLIEL